MAMSKKTIESCKAAVRPANSTPKQVKKGGGLTTPPKRQSPINTQSPQRTSPGLLAGHYAGCKFSEPPLPSALPLPPQHWMLEAPHSAAAAIMPFCAAKFDQQQDIAHQLKVLLKVQA